MKEAEKCGNQFSLPKIQIKTNSKNETRNAISSFEEKANLLARIKNRNNIQSDSSESHRQNRLFGQQYMYTSKAI